MARPTITTSYNQRAWVSSSYTSRLKVWFIMTQALDFLMTQDDNYLVTQDSIVNNYTSRTKITTSYT